MSEAATPSPIYMIEWSRVQPLDPPPIRRLATRGRLIRIDSRSLVFWSGAPMGWLCGCGVATRNACKLLQQKPKHYLTRDIQRHVHVGLGVGCLV